MIGGLVCQETRLAQSVTGHEMLTGVLKDRREGDEEEAPGKGSSRYRMAEGGGHRASFPLYKVQRGCGAEEMGERCKMPSGPQGTSCRS